MKKLRVFLLLLIVLSLFYDARATQPSIHRNRLILTDIDSCYRFKEFIERENLSFIAKDWELFHQYLHDAYGCWGYTLNGEAYYRKNPDGKLNVSRYSEFFSFMNYNEQDIQTISFLFEKLNQGYITKESDEQYEKFKAKVDEINNDSCECYKIVKVYRINGWTGYEEDFFTTGCFVRDNKIEKPLYCIKAHSKLYTLTGSIIAAITLGIFLWKKKTKSRKRSKKA